MAKLVVAVAAGCVLAASENRMPTVVGLAFTLFTAAALGIWAGRGRRAAAFWHGAAAVFVAIATAGLISAVALYRSSSFDQPAVLPPPAVFGIGVIGFPLIWGVVGGVCSWLASELTIAQACAQLGVGRTRFHVLRRRMLGGMLDALEPRRRGRPPQIVDNAEVRALQDRIEELELALHTTALRSEIALNMPYLLDRAGRKKAARRR